MARLRIRLPRPTHPALVAATALIVLAGVAALVLILTTTWYGRCTVDGSGRDGTDCFLDLVTDERPAAWFGFGTLLLAVLGAMGWTGAHLFWIFARWLHHRPGPRGLDGAWYGGRER